MIDPPQVTKVGRIPGGAFCVCAADARKPSIIDCRQPGQVSAWLSHDKGMSWPDRKGEILLKALLAEGGTAVMVFEEARDAELCRGKLLRWTR